MDVVGRECVPILRFQREHASHGSVGVLHGDRGGGKDPRHSFEVCRGPRLVVDGQHLRAACHHRMSAYAGALWHRHDSVFTAGFLRPGVNVVETIARLVREEKRRGMHVEQFSHALRHRRDHVREWPAVVYLADAVGEYLKALPLPAHRRDLLFVVQRQRGLLHDQRQSLQLVGGESVPIPGVEIARAEVVAAGLHPEREQGSQRKFYLPVLNVAHEAAETSDPVGVVVDVIHDADPRLVGLLGKRLWEA